MAIVEVPGVGSFSDVSILTEWNRRFAEQKIRFYAPHAVQRSFHLSQAKTRAIFGGNRSGKTTAGAVEAIWHSTGMYPDWYPSDLRMTQPTRGRIIVTDYRKGMGEVVQVKMREWIPDYAKAKKTHIIGDVVGKYEFSNGSTIDVLTHDGSEAGRQAHEGWAGDWTWFDEPPPRWCYIAAKRGLVDRNGRCWFTLTPLTQPWLKDEILDASFLRTKSIECFLQSMRENPYLGEKEIAEFESTLTEDEKEARLEGRFVFLKGLIYKDLNASVHLIDDIGELPEKNIIGRLTVDPHDRRPSAFLWSYVDRTGDVTYFDEMWIEDKTIVDYVEMIQDIESAWKLTKMRRVIDPNFGNKQYGNTKRTVKDEYRIAGLKAKYPILFRDANNDITYGHNLVRQYLRYDRKKEISADNHPKLYITRRCKKTWEMMTNYLYDDWKGKAVDDREAKDVPKDKNKDFPDCIRYDICDLHRSSGDVDVVKADRTRKPESRIASSTKQKQTGQKLSRTGRKMG